MQQYPHTSSDAQSCWGPAPSYNYILRVSRLNTSAATPDHLAVLFINALIAMFNGQLLRGVRAKAVCGVAPLNWFLSPIANVRGLEEDVAASLVTWHTLDAMPAKFERAEK